MAPQGKELTLCELIKLVTTFGDKITSLEARIVEQNVLLSKQAQEISKLRCHFEGTSTNNSGTRKPAEPTTTNDAPAAAAPTTNQRPIRQARVKAAATAAPTIGARTKKRVSIADATKTPEVSRVHSNTPTTNITASKERVESSCQGGAPLSATNNLSSKTTTDHTDEKIPDWQVVKRKRPAYKHRMILTGSGKMNDNLQVVEQLKYMQAWSFRPDTTVNSILNHINMIETCDKYFVEKRDLQTSRHAAFVIGVPLSLYEQVYTPTVWPPGVKISEWTYFRASPRTRGARAAETGRAIEDRSPSRSRSAGSVNDERQ